MSNTTPKVFLSSTIRDLKDMRSAIKYWLEENGFEVLASEASDFPYALDREAIAAALAPIADCDYYVLLIGSRVGTIIKEGEEKGISVTRAEFRHARNLRRRTGRPQMLHLVRRQVVAARLLGKPPALTDQDWSAIQTFVDEVQTASEPGDSNWLSEFDSFRDVVDVLRSTMHISGPLARRALEANLLWEIRANTRELLEQGKTQLEPLALWFPSDIAFPKGLDSPVHVPPDLAYRMFRFRLTLRESQSVSALEESINSGRFLDYDAGVSSYVVGALHRDLLDLRKQIHSLHGLIKSIDSNDVIKEDWTKLGEASRSKASAEITAFTARMLYAVWSATINVLTLDRAIYRALLGLDAQVQTPALKPLYAYDEESRMKAEEVSEQDADYGSDRQRGRSKRSQKQTARKQSGPDASCPTLPQRNCNDATRLAAATNNAMVATTTATTVSPRISSVSDTTRFVRAIISASPASIFASLAAASRRRISSRYCFVPTTVLPAAASCRRTRSS
jgi:hypothetical protein